MKIKYALLSMPTTVDLTEPYRFSSQVYLSDRRLRDMLIAGKRTDHWQRWLGSLVWERFEGSQPLLCWMPTDRPDVLDAENNQLSSEIECLWFSMILAKSGNHATVWGDQDSIAVSGSGEIVDGQVNLKDIRNYSTYPALLRTGYQQSIKFIEEFGWSHGTGWLDDWKIKNESMWAHKLDKSIFAPVYDFMESFREARTVHSLTTSIARFVEAAETIIALPQRGGGRQVFASRALPFVKEECLKNPWLNWDETALRDNLVRCYEIRISRNHGKGMNDDIPHILGITNENSKELDEAAAKIQFLSELLAKNLFSYVLRHPEIYQFLERRAKLEQAWERDNFLIKM